jgi:mono/diheme cytochrome c family protein
MNRSPRMPAYGTTLSPAQIRALVRHIRSLCQCRGPGWSTDGQASPK